MTQTSPAKVKIKEISQVAWVVKDAWEVVRNFWTILGIGPWQIFDVDNSKLRGRTYLGKPVRAREFMALTWVGPVMLELMQPIEGESAHEDILQESGEGLEHICSFLTEKKDVDRAVEIMAAQGFPLLQQGLPGDDGSFNYIDVKPLRTIWEAVHLPTNRGFEPTCYPDGPPESPAILKVKEINQVSLVVNDVETVAENYWNILGIGPWQFYDWGFPLVYDRKYYGNSVKAREKVAQAQVGPLQLELVQPIEGDTIFQDALVKQREGLHHISIFVDDVDKTAKILTDAGFPSLQSGRYQGGGAFNYIHIKPLRTILGVVCPKT